MSHDPFGYSQNPYAASSGGFHQGGYQQDSRQLALAKVGPPGVAMMVIGIIGLVLYPLSVLFNIIMLASGQLEGMVRPGTGVSMELQAGMRIVFGCILILTSAVITFAGVNMRRLRNYDGCRTGAILAIIPCTTLCCILGIPFGIWAIVALNDPNVASAFYRNSKF